MNGHIRVRQRRRQGPGFCRPRRFGLAVIFLAVGIQSCSIGDLKTEHVVMVNGRGDLIDPRGNWGDPDNRKHLYFFPYDRLGDHESYFARVFDGLERIEPREGGKRKRILLFVHGGLNTAQASISRAAELTHRIFEEGTYPIFLNWDSSLTSSYLEHLVLLRQGRRIDDWCCEAFKEKYPNAGYMAGGFGVLASVVTTPFYLAMDLTRGIFRLPVDLYGVYGELLSSHWRSGRTSETEGRDPWPDGDCSKDADVGLTPRADQLICEYRHPETGPEAASKPYPIAQGGDERTTWESVKQAGLTTLTIPAHLVTGLVVDVGGTGSWSSMRRRTTAMFHRDKDLRAPDPHVEPSGGVSLFMTALREYLHKNGGKDEWEVVLVGHSMGTIVANEMVRQFGHHLEDDPQRRPLFDSIIFMAAACSLRDYLDTIPQYLEVYKTSKMYHLTLHDQAESTEQTFWVTLPGSLLVWIDGFFSRPDSALDLVAGRYQNLLRIMHIHRPGVRDRVTIKAFNFGAETELKNPQTHGDFGEFPFWRETFWAVGEGPPFEEERISTD